MPILEPYVEPIADFKSFVLLLCKMRYVKEWAKDGCLLIGDAAHCVTPSGVRWKHTAQCVPQSLQQMSFIKDLENDNLSIDTLKQVQKSREQEVKMIQELQVTLEKFLTREAIKKDIAPHLFSMATKLPDIKSFQKKLFISREPLDIDETFIFSNEKVEAEGKK